MNIQICNQVAVPIGIIFMFIVSCSNDIENGEQTIEAQKYMGNENNYEDFKEINHNERVNQVKDIINDIEWENAKVSIYSYFFPI
ncbi:hypothetical protein [Neobacillus sp. DY30]|uniref:hypothetical protein n=1 Tax=Neobacillus sp. DY30 TaxID=3047871 RepID=UPI0024C099C1|nr:hypothetical protein [Neobacillus sp. DY30]WHY03259.1 hypothetical protein QNH29_14005 [Neobacillus sp. DY30]